ncbi:MAG TPA: ATP-binding protein [Burkholderiaceae bacterium]|jgi:two-component system OmpR family sensor kinase/two-component system sensor histidine kinase QseC
MNSLRSRLSVSLLLAALLVAAILGYLTYHNALVANEALFDYQLRQTALSLRDQGVVPDLQQDWNGNSEARDVVVQIWTMNGRVLYLSHPATMLPDRATLGFSDVDADGTRWRVYTMIANNRVIQVAQPQAIRRDLVAAAALHSLSPLLIFAPVMAILIWFLVGSGLRPVRQLEQEVTQRNAGTLDPVSEQRLPDEIAPVAHAINSLLAKLRHAFAVQRAFVADAAHELRSPLTALKIQLQVLERAPDETAKISALKKLNDGVDRASHLIEQLLVAARTEATEVTPNMQPVDLAETMRRTMADVFPFAESKQITLDFDAQDNLMIAADSDALKILMRNLLDNAVRYIPQGGTVKAKASYGEGKVTLVIDDSGSGIPEQDRQRVFERFVRGESAGQKGSGLGLSIVKNIVDQHQGTITLSDSPLGGLRVTVAFKGIKE